MKGRAEWTGFCVVLCGSTRYLKGWRLRRHGHAWVTQGVRKRYEDVVGEDGAEVLLMRHQRSGRMPATIVKLPCGPCWYCKNIRNEVTQPPRALTSIMEDGPKEWRREHQRRTKNGGWVG
jgi:hypothetical protein